MCRQCSQYGDYGLLSGTVHVHVNVCEALIIIISVHTCNMYTINFVHITSLSTPYCIILHHLVCESVAYQ